MIPISDYEVFDPTALDDLSLATDFTENRTRVVDPAFWRNLLTALQDVVRTACFIDGSKEPVTDWELLDPNALEWPITLRMDFKDYQQSIGLCYLYEKSVELHLPEAYLLTGNRQSDQQRFQHFWSIERSIRDSIGTSWSYVEWGGLEESTSLDSTTITRHEESVYERAKCEPNQI